MTFSMGGGISNQNADEGRIMRNVDTKQKNAAHVLHSFCFIKPAKKSDHFS